jgi:Protein of unknown function (DUF3047)
MKLFFVPLALMLIFFQFLPFGGTPEEKPEEIPPVKGWWLVSSFSVPPTRYSSVGGGVIKAESRGSRASLFRKVDEKERDFSALSWSWKVSNVVRSAIETQKDRFDAAARVMIVFGKESPWGRVGGGEPSGMKIEYIWASRLPRGKSFDHPGEKNTKVIVLESGDGKAGQWVDESRNIRKDYKDLFGTDPASLLALGIQTDTDHSNEMVTAYYSEPTLRKR